MNRHSWQGISLAELIAVFLILGGLVAILYVVTVPKLNGHHPDRLEAMQVSDIMVDMRSIQTDKVRRNRLLNMPEVHGYRFYELALRNEVLSAETMGKLVSLTAKTDTKMDKSFFDDDSIVLEPENCSWTAPKSSELLSLLAKSGKHRKVIICFNSRNWNNTSSGVLLQFSDGSVAEYYDLELMYDIYPDMFTQEDWADGSNIIGKKPPFDMTFD